MSAELPNSDLALAVTPVDATDLPNGPCRALWIGVGGTLAFKGTNGILTSTTVPVGLFPCKVQQVYATGTAATGILAMY